MLTDATAAALLALAAPSAMLTDATAAALLALAALSTVYARHIYVPSPHLGGEALQLSPPLLDVCLTCAGNFCLNTQPAG